MEQLTLTTPALLFSAISLIMLAFTNRFIAYSNLVRGLHDKFLVSKDEIIIHQIKNLRKRLYLTRAMQILGIASLLLCVFSMFSVFIGQQMIAIYIFGLALVLLMWSFVLMIIEIQISVVALELHLRDIEKHLDDK